MDDEETTLEAEVNRLGGIRDRIGRARFHEQVKNGLKKSLDARAKAKKPKADFAPSEVEFIVSKVTEADIDDAANKVLAAEAEATPAEVGEDAEAKGPIRDWFAANPELVKKVIDYLLRLILGA